MSDVSIQTSTLPSSFCPTSFREGWHEAVPYLIANLTGNLQTINFGSVTPTAENRDKPWVRTDSTGAPTGEYIYYNGYWTRRHPLPVGTILLWEGSAASITTLDDGEAGAVTSLSGPFWEQVTQLNAKFPVGPGTLASGKVLAVTDTGGEEKHVLTKAEMPRHAHNFEVRDKAEDNPNLSPSKITTSEDWEGNAITFTTNPTGGDPDLTTVTDNNEAHNNMPPYYSLYFIRRTARLYYRI